MAQDPWDDAGDTVVKRDRWGRYLLPNPGESKDKPWTRATTFAKSVSDSFGLSQWGQRMVAKGLAMRPDLYALAAATPVEDREMLNSVADQAKDAAASKSGANLGTALHTFTEAVDRGESPDVPAPWDADINAYRAAMTEAGLSVVPRMIERIVVIPGHAVAGTFDRILQMDDGTLVVGDLKTGRSLEYGWGEIAIQLGLYANATHIWDPETKTYEPMPEVNRDFAIVMHLPAGSGTCTLYRVDIRKGWAAAQMCSDVRDWRKEKGLATPFVKTTQDSTEKAPEIAAELSRTATPTYEEQIATALSVDDLRAVWQEAKAMGKWTRKLAALGKVKAKELAA